MKSTTGLLWLLFISCGNDTSSDLSVLVDKGTVRVEGNVVSTVPAGARIVVGSEAPATLRLPNDSRLTFAPASVAMLDPTRVCLFSGSVHLDGADADTFFEVITASGSVRSTGGDFAVEIRPAGRGGETVVTVSQGEVSVVQGDETVRLEAGDRLIFGGVDVVPDSRFAQLRQAFQLDIFRLIQIAQKEVEGGVLVEVEAEEEDHGLELCVEFFKGTDLIQIKLDPRNGKVLEQESERADPDDGFKEIGSDDVTRVLRVALAGHPGIPWSVELERHRGRDRAKVKIARATQSVTVSVDVASGKIIEAKKLNLFDGD